MGEYFLEPKSLEGRVKAELALSNYATKTDLKDAAGVDTSSFPKKGNLGSLKSNADKLDIDKLKNVPTNLNNLERKVDKLDADKLVPVPVDLNKLSDVVKTDIVKMIEYNDLVKKVNIITTGTSNLAKKFDYKTKISENEKKNDHGHDKYSTTEEFDKLTSWIFAVRLKQANLGSINDVANS